jgi:hypothetical protein
MSNVDKNSIEAHAYKLVPEMCGRGGIAIREKEFCRAGRDFFSELNSQQVEFAMVGHRTQICWFGVSGNCRGYIAQGQRTTNEFGTYC